MSTLESQALSVLLEILEEIDRLEESGSDVSKEETRRRLLDERCGVDTPLRIEVERLFERVDTDSIDPVPHLTLDSDEPGVHGSPNLPDRLGEFELGEELGRGGMGVVYLARQRGLDREVAVKVCSSLISTSREIERFHREVRAISRLRDPGIVPVHFVGQEGLFHYYAMERVQGHDLHEEILRQRDAARGERILAPFESREYISAAVRTVASIARALHHAHERGVIHRDVKPRNIMLRSDGRPQLVDFGLARDARNGDRTFSGLCGTPEYMSPEQCKGRVMGDRARGTTDVFSLGIVLFELLTLQRPFEADEKTSVIEQIKDGEPKRLRKLAPRVPRDLEAIVERALEKLVARRYSSAEELADDLDRFLHLETPIAAESHVTLNRLWRKVRRHRSLLAVMLMLALGVFGAAKLGGRSAERSAREGRLTSLQELLDEPDWIGIEVARLVTAQEDLTRLKRAERAGLLEAGQVALLGRVGRRFEELRGALKSEQVRGLATGIAESAEEELLAGQGLKELVSGLVSLQRLLIVFPDEQGAKDLLSERAFWPRVSVTAVSDSGAVHGSVSYRNIDRISGLAGEKHSLGELPLESAVLPPGYHRIIVERDDGDFRELSRLLPIGSRDVTIEAEFRSDQNLTAGMVFVEGGRVRVPALSEVFGLFKYCPNAESDIDLASFWIDEAEVSNAEYLRFLAENPEHPKPVHFDWLQDRAELAEHPIVYVSWNDARAYAEWAGKRLVSHPEWDFAARGRDHRLFPWTDRMDLEQVVYLGNTRGSSAQPFDQAKEAWFEIYADNAAPVRSHPESQNPLGLFHTLGNVSEWTESLGTVPSLHGPQQARAELRFAMGDAWFAEERRGMLDLHSVGGPDRVDSHYTRGFRCGRSDKP